VQVYHHILLQNRRVTSSSQGARSRLPLPSAAYRPYILKQCIGSVTISRQSYGTPGPSRSVPRLPEREPGGTAFTAWRDGDDVLGAVLESLSTDKYLLLPFEQIKRLHITDAQSGLRDLLGFPAILEAHSAQWGGGVLPYSTLIRPGMLMSESIRENDGLDRYGGGVILGLASTSFALMARTGAFSQ